MFYAFNMHLNKKPKMQTLLELFKYMTKFMASILIKREKND
jgi:hypothetical protein